MLRHDRQASLRLSQITIVVTFQPDGDDHNALEVGRMSAAAPNAMSRIESLARQYGQIQVAYLEEECLDLLSL